MHLSYQMLKKSWLHVSLLFCFTAAVALLMILDYFNVESFTLFNERGFYFDYTWKGRMFLLFFLWLFVLESILNWEKLSKSHLEPRLRGYIKVLAVFICAVIPIIYVISVNFLGLNQAVLRIGEALRGDYWRTHSIYWRLILEGDWPLSLEYLVFAISFAATILLAYGRDGLRIFSITLALIAGMGAIYIIDTFYPYGVFKPLQLLALPTAALAAAALEILGYRFTLYFSPGSESMPVIGIYDGLPRSVAIAWPCAGVHSLFLYTLIILLLFKKSNISNFRKIIYFIVGAIGTYSVNVLRVVSYVILLINEEPNAANTFHDTYGELYFITWMFLYISVILCVQKFRLVEKTIHGIHELRHFPSKIKSKLALNFNRKFKGNEK